MDVREALGGEADEQLAQAAAEGSRDAFARLVDRYGGAVLRLSEARLGDPHHALDLSQDIWVRVFRGLSGFRPGARFRPWLFAIALNAARDERRRRRPEALEPTNAELPSAAGPSESELAVAVERALAAVPEPYKSALALVDREGLDYAEAAEALDCAAGTVKSRVHRGRRIFREHWKQAREPVGSRSDRGSGQ